MVSIRGRGVGLAVAASLFGMTIAAQAASERVLYASLGDATRAPIGWVEFCNENPRDCRSGATQARDIVMTQAAWKDLVRVNRWVNETIKPMTDMDHWGVIEKWSYPTDGYGDCEDYVLLKRKMLIDAGWPREALLITVLVTARLAFRSSVAVDVLSVRSFAPMRTTCRRRSARSA